MTPLALEKSHWAKEGRIRGSAYAAELYENGEFVCSAEVVLDKKGSPKGVITAKHCIVPNAEYRVVYKHKEELTLKSQDFKVWAGDITYAPLDDNWKPSFRQVSNFATGSVDIYHSALGRTVKLRGEILFVGEVRELRIGEMLYWLKPTDRIMLVKAVSFGGCSGSPVYLRGQRIGVVSGGGNGMTIISLGR